MISKNVTMFRVVPIFGAPFDNHEYTFCVTAPELDALLIKHKNEVHIKISKPVTPGTEEQNRAAHALLTAFYVSGFASIPDNCTLAEFKVRKKLEYGPVYEFEYRGQTAKIPKSWAEYSKQERIDFIDSLLAEITQSGALAASEKLQEIIKGMETV